MTVYELITTYSFEIGDPILFTDKLGIDYYFLYSGSEIFSGHRMNGDFVKDYCVAQMDSPYWYVLDYFDESINTDSKTSCTCDLFETLMKCGCICGHIQKERDAA